MKTLTKIEGLSADSKFICRWNGRDANENLKANHDVENACIQCGGSRVHLERKLGEAIVSGVQAQVSCVWNDLRKQGWKDGKQTGGG